MMALLDDIAALVRGALTEAQRAGSLPSADVDEVPLERPQKPENGDFASSLPLKLARAMRMSPMKIAEAVAPLIPVGGALDRVWTAPPGFLNFALADGWLAEQVNAVRAAGPTYGNSDMGDGRRVQVEFVSVNPTGPLHVGHARGAVFGSALANVLEAAGYEVEREYYLNDAGTQMDLFNRSLLARYQQLQGADAELPPKGYQGEYMLDLARELMAESGEDYAEMPDEDAARDIGELGLRRMVESIRADMKRIRVRYDVWFSERSLFDGGQYDRAMAVLDEGGFLIDRDGARWFASTKLGDEDDKVLVRSNGAPGYFASDVAYHYEKFFERHFDRVIDVLGADHQGHVRSMKAVATALGIEADRLDLLVYQLVTIKRGLETVRASKRTGDMVTLREVVDEVGADACRFFFLSRSAESQMEFDLELAKKESNENPVYYVQYAHARISGILRLARERGVAYEDGDVSLLRHEAELGLIRKMLELPELVEAMAQKMEPHHLPHYAMELATALHGFYQLGKRESEYRVVSSDPADLEGTKARLKLVDAARIVLARCLSLMLMDAPEEM